MRPVMHLSLHQIHPYVRYVQEFNVPTSQKRNLPFLKAYDHRLFYVYSGSGQICFRDRVCDVVRGDLLLWHAGTEYLQRHSVDHSLVLLGCNFDYTRQHQRKVYPIPPDAAERFQQDLILESIQIDDLPEVPEPILLHNMMYAESVLLKMLDEYRNQKSYADLRLSALMLDLLCQIFREVKVPSCAIHRSTKHVDSIIEFIHQNYSENITNALVGQHFNYHPNYLNKLMVQSTGKSLRQYLIDYRIARAIDLLNTSDEPISSIALSVGFQDICHFNRIFRQKTQHSPSEYRRGLTR